MIDFYPQLGQSIDSQLKSALHKIGYGLGTLK